MIDIGQNFYEEKAFYFNRLSVFRIIINPKVKGYPPLFLLCKGRFGSKNGVFSIALNFLQLNRLMMGAMPNADRLLLAEWLTDFLLPDEHSGEINLNTLFGKPVVLESLDLTTHVQRFHSETACSEPLYYFQLTEA